MSDVKSGIRTLRRVLSNLGFKGLFLLSPGREVEGMRVSVLKACDGGTEETFSRVSEALSMIRRNDEIGYRRVRRYLDRIVVSSTHGSLGWYWHNLRACFLDPVHVAEVTAADLAMTIAHETAHARIRQSGIVWDGECRPRVEAICIRAEIQLASCIPDGLQLKEDAIKRRLLELTRARR